MLALARCKLNPSVTATVSPVFCVCQLLCERDGTERPGKKWPKEARTCQKKGNVSPPRKLAVTGRLRKVGCGTNRPPPCVLRWELHRRLPELDMPPGVPRGLWGGEGGCGGGGGGGGGGGSRKSGPIYCIAKHISSLQEGQVYGSHFPRPTVQGQRPALDLSLSKRAT